MLFFGSPVHHHELRVRAAVELYTHPELFAPRHLTKIYGWELSTNDICQLIYASFPQKKDFKSQSIKEVLRERASTILVPGTFGSILEIIALGKALDVNWNVIYPCDKNPFVKKKLFSGIIKCGSGINRQNLLLCWAKIGGNKSDNQPWIPNHFVPCEPASAEIRMGIVSRLRQHLMKAYKVGEQLTSAAEKV